MLARVRRNRNECTAGGVQFYFRRVNIEIRVEIIRVALFLTKKENHPMGITSRTLV